jgi:peptide-methionine (S)-S-oxide reductase
MARTAASFIMKSMTGLPAGSLDNLFCEAVSAIDAGDVATLDRLIAANPQLVRDRLESPGAWLRDKVGESLDNFFKRPYLLWFVSEDPARNRELPRNVAEVARTIIKSVKRENVDLENQLDYALHLAVCSPIGRKSGLQLELIDALLDEGASVERQSQDCGGVPGQALICGNTSAAEHLIERGAEVTLPAAICLERWDDVARLLPTATARDKQVSLALAALNGRAQGLARLVDAGVDLDAYATGFYTHATPLHHAVGSGSLDAVKVLVEAGAKLETKDTAWNGTPLGWAEYYPRTHEPDDRTVLYAAIAAYLRDHGAKND